MLERPSVYDHGWAELQFAGVRLNVGMSKTDARYPGVGVAFRLYTLKFWPGILTDAVIDIRRSCYTCNCANEVNSN